MNIDLNTVPHHPAIDQITRILSKKTQNNDMPFLRVMTANFLAKVASSMRAVLVTKDRGKVPVNVYALSLATSGSGKGHSVNILESQIFKGFKDRFLTEAHPIYADNHLWKITNERALRKGVDPDQERLAVEAVFDGWLDDAEVRRHVEIARRVQAVIADMQDLLRLLGAAHLRQHRLDLRQDRVADRLEGLRQQGRTDGLGWLTTAQRDQPTAHMSRYWRLPDQESRQVEDILQVVAITQACTHEADQLIHHRR